MQFSSWIKSIFRDLLVFATIVTVIFIFASKRGDLSAPADLHSVETADDESAKKQHADEVNARIYTPAKAKNVAAQNDLPTAASVANKVDKSNDSQTDSETFTSHDLGALQADCEAEILSNRMPKPGQLTSCERYAKASNVDQNRPSTTNSSSAQNSLEAMQRITRDMQVAQQSSSHAIHCPALNLQPTCQFSYRKGSIDYRNCRLEFKNMLVSKCANLKSFLANHGEVYNSDSCFRTDEQQYCAAAASFQPVEG